MEIEDLKVSDRLYFSNWMGLSRSAGMEERSTVKITSEPKKKHRSITPEEKVAFLKTALAGQGGHLKALWPTRGLQPPVCCGRQKDSSRTGGSRRAEEPRQLLSRAGADRVPRKEDPD
jgi:hypothetical protein